MTIEEFFRGLKGNDARLLAELDGIRRAYGLEKLYLIYMNPSRILVGVRSGGGTANWFGVASNFWLFLRRHVETDAQFGPSVVFDLLTGPREEVLGVLDIDAIPYGEKHGVHLSLIRVDEVSGRVIISAKGGNASPALLETIVRGVERTLKSMLPWVRSVESGA